MESISNELQSYGLMLETYDYRQAVGDVPPDIGGSGYVSCSVKQLSVGLMLAPSDFSR